MGLRLRDGGAHGFDGTGGPGQRNGRIRQLPLRQTLLQQAAVHLCLLLSGLSRSEGGAAAAGGGQGHLHGRQIHSGGMEGSDPCQQRQQLGLIVMSHGFGGGCGGIGAASGLLSLRQ